MQRTLQETLRRSLTSSFRIIVDNARLPSRSELDTAASAYSSSLHLAQPAARDGSASANTKKQRKYPGRQLSFEGKQKLHRQERWSAGSEVSSASFTNSHTTTNNIKNNTRIDNCPMLPTGKIPLNRRLSLVQVTSASA